MDIQNGKFSSPEKRERDWGERKIKKEKDYVPAGTVLHSSQGRDICTYCIAGAGLALKKTRAKIIHFQAHLGPGSS